MEKVCVKVYTSEYIFKVRSFDNCRLGNKNGKFKVWLSLNDNLFTST